jgi:6-phosphogluconolactonase (cycloisomerase 2 family)
LPLIYAVSEDSPSSLHVFASDEPHAPVASLDIGGADGCHVLVSPDARALHVALYSSGELASISLDAAGLPVETSLRRHAYAGSGPRVDRQEAPHAHFVAFAPGGRDLLVVDLGSDAVWAHPLDDAGLPGEPHIALRTPGGAGPRHLAVRGELLYIVCELDHTLRTARWDRASATAELLGAQPVTLAPQRTGEDVFDAHVELVERPMGDVLLASVRGADVIAVWDVAPEGELRYRAAFDAGHWPRHFTVTPDAGGAARVVVTAARGHEIRSYAVEDVLALAPETENGAIAELPFESASVTSPACICPA